MNSKRSNCIFVTVCIALAIAVQLAAQDDQKPNREHHRYKVVDLGTLGGPASFIPNPWSQDINRSGTVIAEADTRTLDPNAPNCFQPDCLVNHAIKWHKGVRTDLGALPGLNSSFPAWVNERGSITGFSENGLIDPLTGFPEVVAVLWRDEEIIQLGTFGGNASYANAINNRGQIVGGALNTTLDPFASGFWPGFTFFPVATQLRAFLWEDGVMHDLGTLGGPDSAALFLNGRGQVAGASYTNSTPNATTGNPTQDPFLWIPCDRDRRDSDDCRDDPESTAAEDGRMLDLGTLGGTFGYPYWLNNRGEVVGQSNLKGDRNVHPFLWDGKSMRDLGTLGGDDGIAYSVNEAGEVVGVANMPGNQAHHAFLWRRGAMTDLGTPEGSQCSRALSINSRGQIVGESSVICGPNNPGPGWLWENGGPPVNLDVLLLPGSEFINVEAVFINDRGEIAANGTLQGSGPHAVLLLPCDGNHPDLKGCDYEPVVTTASTKGANPAAIDTMSPGSYLPASNRWTRRGAISQR